MKELVIKLIYKALKEKEIKLKEEEIENPIKINYKTHAVIISPEKQVKKPVIKEDLPEPVIVESELTPSRYYPIFDEKEKKTGLYVEDWLYQKLSKEKKNGELLKLPGLDGLHIKAGQGRLTSFFNTFTSGGNYTTVYSNKGVVEGRHNWSCPCQRQLWHKR